MTVHGARNEVAIPAERLDRVDGDAGTRSSVAAPDLSNDTSREYRGAWLAAATTPEPSSAMKDEPIHSFGWSRRSTLTSAAAPGIAARSAAAINNS